MFWKNTIVTNIFENGCYKKVMEFASKDCYDNL